MAPVAEELLPPPPRPTPSTSTALVPVPKEPERPVPWSQRRFWWATAAIAGVGLVLRLRYVFTDHRLLIPGDGFDYNYSALRLADGYGYTRGVGKLAVAAAHHPPGWTTLLGAVSWLGGRSLHAHQLTGVALGIVLIVLVAMIGRRYFDARTGLIAAALAALYPGFWLLEGNILSEPLALVLLAVVVLLVADLRERPTLLRCVVVGAVSGLLALTRPEQIVVVAIIVAPVLLTARGLSLGRRLGRLVVLGLVAAIVIAPWSIFNTARLHEPVLVSTGDGGTFLAGNCTPGSYEGARIGFWDNTCLVTLVNQHPDYNAAQVDSAARRQGWENLTDNSDRWPVTVAARYGRLLAVFRPGQTVDFVAQWMGVDNWLIWAWVVSFWVLFPLSIAGFVLARRRDCWTWPLVVPFLVVLVEMLVFYGEPRYHSVADLGVVVLAAFTVDRIYAARAPAPRGPSSRSSRGGRGRSRSSRRPGRLPSVYVPR